MLCKVHMKRVQDRQELRGNSDSFPILERSGMVKTKLIIIRVLLIEKLLTKIKYKL